MAFRFKLQESLGKGVRRIAGEEIAKARRQLSSAVDDPTLRPTAIHDTRRAMKRVRALLRLARPELGRTLFARENDRYRTIARELSAARDLHVLTSTLRGLIVPASHAAAAAMLEQAIAEAGDQLPFGEQHVRRTLAALEDALPAVAAWRCGQGRSPTAAGGLPTSYRAGRLALARASESCADEDLHELRKSVQVHWRHTQLLVQAWPHVMTARVTSAHEISEQLGTHRDLALLAAFTRRHLTGRQGKPAADRIVELCRCRQHALQASALPGACRLYAERPRQLARNIERWWRAAREIAATAADATALAGGKPAEFATGATRQPGDQTVELSNGHRPRAARKATRDAL